MLEIITLLKLESVRADKVKNRIVFPSEAVAMHVAGSAG